MLFQASAGNMMTMSNQMSEMMGKMSGMMKDMPKGNMKTMSGVHERSVSADDENVHGNGWWQDLRERDENKRGFLVRRLAVPEGFSRNSIPAGGKKDDNSACCGG